MDNFQSDMSVTFLGTSSGGGPSESRNCSSLVCNMLADQSLWMVDCAEGTTRQFSQQPAYSKPYVRMNKVSKIFITHMHADHIMGIVPFLRNVLFPPLAGTPSLHSTGHSPSRTIEIYGPAGLRLFVRQVMKMTLTRTSDKYVVHELLTSEDSSTPCDRPQWTSGVSPSLCTSEPNVLHPNELAGSDIRASPDGLWRAIAHGTGVMSPIIVDAGPILHRDPCIGYTFTEIKHPMRKVVILGDTYDPSAMIPLCLNPSPSLLIHEATDSCISRHADSAGKLSRRSANEIQEKALARGHSIPEMAGAFAKLVRAESLVLNHIGARFPAPRSPWPKDYDRHKIIQDIEQRASGAWSAGRNVIAAYDFLRIHVYPRSREDSQSRASSSGSRISSDDEEPNGSPPSVHQSQPRRSKRSDKHPNTKFDKRQRNK